MGPGELPKHPGAEQDNAALYALEFAHQLLLLCMHSVGASFYMRLSILLILIWHFLYSYHVNRELTREQNHLVEAVFAKYVSAPVFYEVNST